MPRSVPRVPTGELPPLDPDHDPTGDRPLTCCDALPLQLARPRQRRCFPCRVACRAAGMARQHIRQPARKRACLRLPGNNWTSCLSVATPVPPTRDPSVAVTGQCHVVLVDHDTSRTPLAVHRFPWGPRRSVRRDAGCGSSVTVAPRQHSGGIHAHRAVVTPRSSTG